MTPSRREGKETDPRSHCPVYPPHYRTDDAAGTEPGLNVGALCRIKKGSGRGQGCSKWRVTVGLQQILSSILCSNVHMWQCTARGYFTSSEKRDICMMCHLPVSAKAPKHRVSCLTESIHQWGTTPGSQPLPGTLLFRFSILYLQNICQ